MYNHEPPDYRCPLCAIAQGIEEKDFPQTKQADIIFQDEMVTCFVASVWLPQNKGHVIVIPNQHFENLYDLPDDFSARISSVARKTAIVIKEAYCCDGISTRQHNEPAGDQYVWHYHLHIYPRYQNDNFYSSRGQDKLVSPEERISFVEKLRSRFKNPGLKLSVCKCV